MSDTIINSFDIWTDAQGVKSKGRVKSIENISLDGVLRLRELIFELALRGKLVSQDPNDEPASELLKNIIKEKAELTKKGMPKRGIIPEISDQEKPFKLPENWHWVRLGQIIQISSGDGLTASQMSYNGNIPVFGGNGINGYHDKANVTKPTLVIGRVGFYCGSVHITPNLAWVTDNAFITCFSENNIDLSFLSLLLKGTNLKENDSATAQPVISGRKVYPIVVALPPFAEQKRIIAKVGELMVFCDRLEQKKNKNLRTHQVLVETLLETLKKASDANDLQKAWQRISSHFETLFCTEDSIEQLKQTILQLAIMGRLVKQNPNDEPASDLLKKIEKEKVKLVNEGKLKKEKPLPIITEEEKPFAIPKCWEWVRLGTITNKIGSGSTPRGGNNAYSDAGIIFLRSQNIRNEGVLLEDVAYIDAEINKKMSNTVVLPNDILLNITGGSLGRSAVFPDNLKVANVSQHVTIIRPTITASSSFLHKSILSPYIQDLIWGRQIGANREGLSKKVLELFEIPYPPIAEQTRIVEKVDELMILCDSLKSRINKSQEIQGLLSKTIIENAIT